MSRVLVIGGTLFIGRTLVEQLLARGDEVTVMHRGAGTPFGGRVRELRCDRNDAEAVQATLAGERFDIVYDNVYDWQRGTTAEQVLAAPRALEGRLRRYVFTSTVAVYGEAGGEHDEDAALVPPDARNDYARHKAESERALFALGRETGLEVATLRPAFVHGAHNPFEREAWFWDRILADRPVILPDDGARTMQWVWSEDVARAAVAAATSPAAVGRAYNLAAEPVVTQLEFVRVLARVAGREARVVHVPREALRAAGGKAWAPPLYFGEYLDIPPITMRTGRVRAELGVEVASLEAGLRETFRWYARQSRPAPDIAWEDTVLAR